MFKIINIFILKLISNLIPNFISKLLINNFMYKPYIRLYKLEENPTILFNSILIELRTKCNNTCPFCSANINNDQREDVTMPFSLYNKIIDELAEINFNGRVALFNNNEPLLVPNLEKYTEIAVKKLKNVNIFHICTNGLLLNLEKGKKLIKAGINFFTINIYNDDLKKPIPNKIMQFKKYIEEYNKTNKKQIKEITTKRKKISSFLIEQELLLIKRMHY